MKTPKSLALCFSAPPMLLPRFPQVAFSSESHTRSPALALDPFYGELPPSHRLDVCHLKWSPPHLPLLHTTLYCNLMPPLTQQPKHNNGHGKVKISTYFHLGPCNHRDVFLPFNGITQEKGSEIQGDPAVCNRWQTMARLTRGSTLLWSEEWQFDLYSHAYLPTWWSLALTLFCSAQLCLHSLIG